MVGCCMGIGPGGTFQGGWKPGKPGGPKPGGGIPKGGGPPNPGGGPPNGGGIPIGGGPGIIPGGGCIVLGSPPVPNEHLIILTFIKILHYGTRKEQLILKKIFINK